MPEEKEEFISKEEFLKIYDLVMDNFAPAESLSDSGEDAMTTDEILEVVRGVNPFITSLMLVKQLQIKFRYQFDFRDKQLKWLLKYRAE